MDASSQAFALRNCRLMGNRLFASMALRFVDQAPFEIALFKLPVTRVRLPKV